MSVFIENRVYARAAVVVNGTCRRLLDTAPPLPALRRAERSEFTPVLDVSCAGLSMDLVARVSVVDAGVATGLVVTDLVAPDHWPARAAVYLRALLVLGDALLAARLAVRADPRAR